jgi:alpha-mannosidase
MTISRPGKANLTFVCAVAIRQRQKSSSRIAALKPSQRAETLASLVSHATGETTTGADDIWQGVRFNSFHDILPG